MIPKEATAFGYSEGRHCDAVVHTGKAMPANRYNADFSKPPPHDPLEAFRPSQLPRGVLNQDTQCVIDETGAIRSRFMVKRERRQRKLPVRRAASSLRAMLRDGCTSNNWEQESCSRMQSGLKANNANRRGTDRRSLRCCLPLNAMYDNSPVQMTRTLLQKHMSKLDGVQQQMAHPPDTASSWSTIFENKDWLNPKAQFDESRFKTQSQILIRDVATDFGFDPPTNRTPTRTPMTPTRRSPLRDSLRGCTPMGDFTRGNSSVGGSIAGSMASRETGLFGAL